MWCGFDELKEMSSGGTAKLSEIFHGKDEINVRMELLRDELLFELPVISPTGATVVKVKLAENATVADLVDVLNATFGDGNYDGYKLQMPGKMMGSQPNWLPIPLREMEEQVLTAAVNAHTACLPFFKAEKAPISCELRVLLTKEVQLNKEVCSLLLLSLSLSLSTLSQP